jgi:adenosylhomocysteine nucleosidase
MSQSAPLGIVTGLKFEAAIVKRQRGFPGTGAPLVKAVGGSADAAEAAAREMLVSEVQGLVSFGIAGALDPSLKAGTLVLPDRVTGPDRHSFRTDVGWNKRLTAQLPGTIQVSRTDLASVAEPVLLASQKKALAQETKAGAVDMESAAVAKVAAAHEVPFIAIRAIADEAGSDLPQAAQVAMGADGSVNVWRVLFSLISQPTQLAQIARLGGQNKKAKRTLHQVAQTGLPWFGLNQ